MNGRIKRENSDPRGQLPLLGRIKVGEKKLSANNKEYPVSLDYFRATGKYSDKFNAVFGDKPSKVGIVFISDNINEVCRQYFASWEGGKLNGEGDGETFRVWDANAGPKDRNGNPTGDYVSGLPKTDPRVKAIKGWEEYVELNFVIPSIKDVLGYWRFLTKGKKSSIPAIINTFDFIQQRAGTVIGFPFDLTVSKASGYTPGQARSYPVVSLVPNRGEENITAIKNFLTAGGRIEDIATISINEKKLMELAQSNDVPVIEAEVIDETKNQE